MSTLIHNKIINFNFQTDNNAKIMVFAKWGLQSKYMYLHVHAQQPFCSCMHTLTQVKVKIYTYKILHD